MLSCDDFINDTREKDSLSIEKQTKIIRKIKALFITCFEIITSVLIKICNDYKYSLKISITNAVKHNVREVTITEVYRGTKIL